MLTPRGPEDPAHVRRRLDAIERLRVLDRIGDPALTSLTRLATYVTGGRAAAVHILDDTLQRRIAATGAPLESATLADSMCQEVLRTEQRIVCADASVEPRFAGSPFAAGPDPVRFYAAVPLRVQGGVVVGTLCAFDGEERAITAEQVALLEDLAEQASTHIELVRIATELGQAAVLDPLTGAVNRVMFHDRLAHALVRRDRRHTAVLVLLLDVDDFKRVNDEHGHEHGDRVLRWVVGQLVSATRAEDTIGRLGGDEFGVIIELDEPEPDGVVERIHEALCAATEFPTPSVSYGAAIARYTDDVTSALHRADQAMFLAKRRRQAAAIDPV